jgi:hypothetical protein
MCIKRTQLGDIIRPTLALFFPYNRPQHELLTDAKFLAENVSLCILKFMNQFDYPAKKITEYECRDSEMGTVSG